MKILKPSLLFLLLILGISSIFAQDGEVAELKVKQIQLDNGLTVFLHEDHSHPEVFGVVITKVGGKNDPKDATGLAHYMEHMLFKGTTELGTTNWEDEKPYIDKIFSLYDELGKTTDETQRAEIQKQINEASLEATKYAIPNEMSNIINSIGGTNMNAGTGPDVTMFYNAFPPHQIEKWLDLYSHRFIKPVFRSFQAELEVVYEEKNMYSDMFQFSLMEEFQKQFFKIHPYGQQPLVGTLDDLKNPSLTKMYEFFKTYYVANNMALILSGDFDSETIIPIIKEKFGKWKSGDIPTPIKYEEQKFEGREFIEKKLSPIKLGIIGYRTVPQGDPDEIPLEIANNILSNSSQTGLLDKLMLDNKLLAAMMMPLPYNDYGGSVILMIPKIVGQSLEEAEQLVLDELGNLKKGEFDETVLESIKQQLLIDFITSMESNQRKALMIADAFGRGLPVKDISEKALIIQSINKQQVIDIANKYYGDDFLVLYSKMGSQKKEKIDKPGFKPVISNVNAKSEYAKRFEKIKVEDPVIKYVDFDNDLTIKELNSKTKLYVVENKQNDIFDLTFKFGVGSEKMPLLEYSSMIMSYAGTSQRPANDIKKEFSTIGCNYSFYSTGDYFYVNLSGLEYNLREGLRLLTELMYDPSIDHDKISVVKEGVASERKMERSEPDNIADALFDYVLYGDKSDYLDRFSSKEINSLTNDQLIEAYKTALNYQVEIHYTGKLAADEIKNIISESFPFNDEMLESESPIINEANVYTENIIYFVNKKKAVQSKVYFFVNGFDLTKEQIPKINAFNMYFGGGFSGLVLQEIREYRSLAYTAAAMFTKPQKEHYKSNFIGYVGTQSDKTLEALEVFDNLINDMPEKDERMNMIKMFLMQSLITNKPKFRSLSESVSSWKTLGYEEDPSISKLEAYKNLEFEDIVTFYQSNLKGKPTVIAIVGDKKRIDMKELAKYGKIVKIKEKKLFKK